MEQSLPSQMKDKHTATITNYCLCEICSESSTLYCDPLHRMESKCMTNGVTLTIKIVKTKEIAFLIYLYLSFNFYSSNRIFQSVLQSKTDKQVQIWLVLNSSLQFMGTRKLSLKGYTIWKNQMLKGQHKILWNEQLLEKSPYSGANTYPQWQSL